ncbi:lipoprotein 17-related variable surface protein [Mycoplasmopsis pulmonis]|uniref:lipoprotein 17-related variable surface protein n=1 Tax=Mycoplasmopsis pulmonis TaxID=2107 RepID=UPI002ACD6D17|nr:lipoprotein 17-related variable surface protein [Mycoplasmopsis pulmonis]MDZ7293503.1 lipoprotein 17-related variable surface protein [Mycoplasmopsis pulmonis]
MAFVSCSLFAKQNNQTTQQTQQAQPSTPNESQKQNGSTQQTQPAQPSNPSESQKQNGSTQQANPAQPSNPNESQKQNNSTKQKSVQDILKDEMNEIGHIYLKLASTLKNKKPSEIKNEDLTSKHIDAKIGPWNNVYTPKDGISLTYSLPTKNEEKKVDDDAGTLNVILTLSKGNESLSKTFRLSQLKGRLSQEIKKIHSIIIKDNKQNDLKNKLPSELKVSDLTHDKLKLNNILFSEFVPSEGTSVSFDLAKDEAQKEANDDLGSINIIVKLKNWTQEASEEFQVFGFKTKTHQKLEAELAKITSISLKPSGDYFKNLLPREIIGQHIRDFYSKLDLIKQDGTVYKAPREIKVEFEITTEQSQNVENNNKGEIDVIVKFSQAAKVVTKIYKLNQLKKATTA